MRIIQSTVVACVFALTACTSTSSVEFQYGGRPGETAVYGAVAAWASHPGLAYLPPRCSKQLDRLRVARVRSRVMEDRCASTDCLQSSGCEFPWSCFSVVEDSPVIWVWAALPQDTRCLERIHQTLHWLGYCTGSGLDMMHNDPYRWQDVLLLSRAVCR